MTQKERILRHLQSGETITGVEALREYGVGHLASRISELRTAGHNIVGATEAHTNKYGEKVYCVRYRLEA